MSNQYMKNTKIKSNILAELERLYIHGTVIVHADSLVARGLNRAKMIKIIRNHHNDMESLYITKKGTDILKHFFQPALLNDVKHRGHRGAIYILTTVILLIISILFTGKPERPTGRIAGLNKIVYDTQLFIAHNSICMLITLISTLLLLLAITFGFVWIIYNSWKINKSNRIIANRFTQLNLHKAFNQEQLTWNNDLNSLFKVATKYNERSIGEAVDYYFETYLL